MRSNLKEKTLAWFSGYCAQWVNKGRNRLKKMFEVNKGQKWISGHKRELPHFRLILGIKRKKKGLNRFWENLQVKIFTGKLVLLPRKCNNLKFLLLLIFVLFFYCRFEFLFSWEKFGSFFFFGSLEKNIDLTNFETILINSIFIRYLCLFF